MQMMQKHFPGIIVPFLGSENLQIQIEIAYFIGQLSLCLSTSLIVSDFSNEKLKKLYRDFNCISHL